MIQGQVMGWIVVGGFAITLIVTILGMIQVVSIQKRYLNRLFALMIVELISAGFFLFYKEFNPPELVFDPPLQSQFTFLATTESHSRRRSFDSAKTRQGCLMKSERMN